MKFRKALFAVMAILALSGLIIEGCAKKTGVQRAEKTTSSAQAVETDINRTIAQIDVTNASLNQVLNSKNSPDIRKVYDSYAGNVAKMEKTGNVLLKHTDQLAVQGNNYFEEWQKTGSTYTNPEIQKLSQQQRNEVQQSFNRISQASVGVKGYLNAYLSNIKQIQTYLSNDLTPNGISAISPVASSTIQSGDRVKQELQPMLAATSSARAQLTAGAAAGGPAGQTQSK